MGRIQNHRHASPMKLFTDLRSLPIRRSGRVGVAVALLAACLGFGGCAAVEAKGNREMFVRRAPMPTLVPRAEVLKAAQRQAAATEGDFALMGLGRSMEPFYRGGTAVVVHPTSYHMLQSGMAVVYRNRSGGYVAHMLMRKTERGWLVMGLNNPTPDGSLVTERNVVGIIKHAFVASDTPFQPDVASQIAAYHRAPHVGIAPKLAR